MRKSLTIAGALIVVFAVVALPSRTKANHQHRDFGSFVESQLAAHSEQLFGINRPLEESALGPYDGPNNLQAIQVAPGLRVSLVSSSVASAADQIALWPDDDNPKFLFAAMTTMSRRTDAFASRRSATRAPSLPGSSSSVPAKRPS